MKQTRTFSTIITESEPISHVTNPNNMSKCNNLMNGPDCENPPQGGNTYEITIKDSDRLIITVESKFVANPIKTIMSPRGIEQCQTSRGLMYHKVDWSIQPETEDLE